MGLASHWTKFRYELKLEYDLKTKELSGAELPNFLDSNPKAYDPSKFLLEHLEIPVEFSKPILEHLHDDS